MTFATYFCPNCTIITVISSKNFRFLEVLYIMQISELLPEMIKDLAPTGPLPMTTSAQLVYWRQLATKRLPGKLPKGYLVKEDEFLQKLWQQRMTLTLADLTEIRPGIYLTQGDITNLKVDAIVNASDNAMLGCFTLDHPCLDNEVHLLAGSRLREECAQMMQGQKVPAGQVRITKGYHLPSAYIMHAVAPKVVGELTETQKKALADCYEACLTLALEKSLSSIAFCSLGTGARNFPSPAAASIAYRVITNFHQLHPEIKIVLSPYKDIDHELYRYLFTH